MSAIRAEYFLDTNIFVYRFHTEAPAKAQRAEELITVALDSGRGVTSYQVAQEFCNVALRGRPSPIRPADVARFLDSDVEPLVRVESSVKLLLGGLRLHERFRLSWYDALIVAAAQEAHCRILYSEDFQHGQQFDSVRVVDPFR